MGSGRLREGGGLSGYLTPGEILLLLSESGTVVSLLRSAASAPGHPSHAGAWVCSTSLSQGFA